MHCTWYCTCTCVDNLLRCNSKPRCVHQRRTGLVLNNDNSINEGSSRDGTVKGVTPGSSPKPPHARAAVRICRRTAVPPGTLDVVADSPCTKPHAPRPVNRDVRTRAGERVKQADEKQAC